MIIGCDFHPSFQQVAYVDQETGEYGERRLQHREEAVRFYRSLGSGQVRVGVEATGNDRWFRKLLGEEGHELAVGDASAIHAAAPREQRTDKRDARHILRLLVENRFPQDYVAVKERGSHARQSECPVGRSQGPIE